MGIARTCPTSGGAVITKVLVWLPDKEVAFEAVPSNVTVKKPAECLQREVQAFAEFRL